MTTPTHVRPHSPAATTAPAAAPTVIGLNGFARSGKDTAAQALIARGFVRIALADPIREALLVLDPYVGFTASGPVRLATALSSVGGDWDLLKKHELFGNESRRQMQVLGTEVARIQWWDGFWLDLADQKMAALRAEGHTRFVITDVRFPNEGEWARAHGWPVVRITRPGVGPVNGHSSEAGLPDELVDHEVANDGTIEALHRKVADLAVTLGVR
ncbi:hypothetical protein LG293_16195 (plasmid) [Citricoccus nitrophenolicus]